MPQMSPLNWLTLFMYFTVVLMTINIMNFYVPSPLKKYVQKMASLYTNTWKW